jgi:hypothetical protein
MFSSGARAPPRVVRYTFKLLSEERVRVAADFTVRDRRRRRERRAHAIVVDDVEIRFTLSKELRIDRASFDTLTIR